jgi:putative membrane protein
MNEPSRRPAAFRIDDPRVIVAAPESAVPDNSDVAVIETAERAAAAARARRWRWGALFWSAASAFVMLALGVAITNFVEELFARSPWLGTAGAVFAGLAAFALVVILLREMAGLARLGSIAALRERAEQAIQSDDRAAGAAVAADLLALTRRMPRLAHARNRVEAHLSDIIDGRDRVRLAERELLGPLDAQARQMVSAAAKRVSVVTAVSPRAAVDMLFVLVNALMLIRKLAVLYGGRPGTLGVLKLFRQVISHLALTGGVALTDSVLQQVIGHGVAARLSARLGEGILNGILTARLGILAVEVTRPLPFSALPRPALNDLAGMLLRTEAREGPVSRPSVTDGPEK